MAPLVRISARANAAFWSGSWGGMDVDMSADCCAQLPARGGSGSQSDGYAVSVTCRGERR